MSGPWFYAGAVLAVVLLIGLAAIYGHRGTASLDSADEARAIADTIPGGFDAIACVLDAEGTGALLRDANGRIVLVAPHGAHFTPHLIGPGDTLRVAGSTLQVRVARRSFTLELGAVATEWHQAVDARMPPHG